MAGDGEIQEGQIWEAAMSAAHYHLDNIMLFVDCNGLQIDGTNDEVMTVNPVSDKFKPLAGMSSKLTDMITRRSAVPLLPARASRINRRCHQHSVKGKGVSFMEIKWDGTARLHHRNSAPRRWKNWEKEAKRNGYGNSGQPMGSCWKLNYIKILASSYWTRT